MTLIEALQAQEAEMEKQAGAKDAVVGAGKAVHGYMGEAGKRIGTAVGASEKALEGKTHAIGYGAHAAGAAGLALGARALLKRGKQSAGQRLVGAMKNNRKALIGGAAAAAGAGGLAAYMKRDKK